MRHDNNTANRGICCPSVRLEISKGSGRLKWRVRSTKKREETEWHHQKKMRLMLAVLMVLLPVGLILGVVSQLYIKEKRTYTQYDNNKQNVYDDQFTYDPERTEFEDRELMQDLRTKFVQPYSAIYSIRSRRNAASLEEIQTWDTFQGNVTSDLIIWDVKEPASNTGALNGVGHVINSDDNRFSPLIRKITKSTRLNTSHTNKKYPSQISINTLKETETSRNLHSQATSKDNNSTSPLPDEKGSEVNTLSGTYPRDDVTDDLGMNENQEKDKATDIVYDEPEIVKEKEQAQTWRFYEDERTSDEDDIEFLTFWKYKGDGEAIRDAQARMMKSYMDTTADPCEDFYQYACGNWGKKNPIPKDKAAFDTFEMLRENLDIVLKEVLEEETNTVTSVLEEDLLKNDATLKARNFYKSCMNYEILEERGVEPLINLLDELGGWPMIRPEWDATKFDWILLMAQLRLYNNDILVSQWVGPDIKNSDEYVIQFDQTSLGLPTRDYFLQPLNENYLEAYKHYLLKISTLLGAPLENATQQTEEIIDFETKLARITSSPEERRNVSVLYQRMTVGELRQSVPQVDWDKYLSVVLARPVNYSEPVVIFALTYVQDLVSLIAETPSRTVANYLLWRFVRHRVNNLDDRFQDAKQKFYYILFGREESPPRWKNCVSQVNTHLGMALGALFVQKYFDENSKNDTLHMTEDIMHSFRDLLSHTTWIDRQTKDLAAQKVDAMMLRIGYPDFILNSELLNERYKDLKIHPDKFFENTLSILKHLTRTEQDHLGTPVNKTVWNTAPAVVNAYYSRNKNQIMFPAGILQPPFYHRYFPRSLNYGGIGVVVGHEITHGFDDKGRLFDKDGNLHRWWQDEAVDGFHQRAQCLIDQYSLYTVQEVAMQIDGMNTQGENIADNGGIKQAFRAYQKWLEENGDANETLPGLNATGHQLFFLNFAQIWCGTMRPEATRNKLKTAVHSPGKFRVIGTLSNSEEFASVFNCEEGTPMNPANKCSVW